MPTQFSVYVSTEKEINTIPLLQEILDSGKRLGVPKCTGKRIMDAYEIQNLEQLKLDPTESWSREKNVISSLIRQKSSLRSSHVFPVTGRVNGSDMAGGIMTVILRKCRKTVKKQFCAEKV